MNHDEHRAAIERRPFAVQSKRPGSKFLTIPGCTYSDQAAALECLTRNRATWSIGQPRTSYRIFDERKYLTPKAAVTFALSTT